LPPSYALAAQIIPPVALGFVFFGWYLIPMDTIVLVAGRTRWIFICTAAAAATNVMLNLLLVPTFGVMAAAINTAIGYAVLLAFVVLYGRSQPSSRVAYDWRAIAGGCLAMLASYALTLAVTPLPNDIASVAIRVAILMPVAVLLLVTASRESSLA
jgi:O-antigen/teichoic acid export membrane protein